MSPPTLRRQQRTLTTIVKIWPCYCHSGPLLAPTMPESLPTLSGPRTYLHYSPTISIQQTQNIVSYLTLSHYPSLSNSSTCPNLRDPTPHLAIPALFQSLLEYYSSRLFRIYSPLLSSPIIQAGCVIVLYLAVSVFHISSHLIIFLLVRPPPCTPPYTPPYTPPPAHQKPSPQSSQIK